MRIGIDASRAFVEEPTGTERYSFEVITRLVALPEARKHEWILYIRDVIPTEALAKWRDPSTSLGMTIKRIGLPYLWTQVGLAARTWIDELDVLWVPAHTLPVFRRAGLRTVVTIHGIEYEWLPAYENVLQRWYLPLSTKYAVGGADKIIAVSEFTKRQLVERLNADPKKIDVVYEGVSQNLKFEVRNSKSILSYYNLQKKKYLLFVGTIQPRKNLERLVEAFLRIKDDKLRLVICGKWGWGYEKLRDIQKRNIVFTGYVNDEERRVLLENALVYVQPSITEGFGLPVLEAMRAGVPVASSNGGALAEVVGDSGELFDPNDIDDMKNKIELAMGNKKLIASGEKRAQEFSWEKAARKTYNILTKWL